MSGVVRWFNQTLHYGYINMDDGRSVFVHKKQLLGLDTLAIGQRVEFDLYEMDKGLEAKNVREPE